MRLWPASSPRSATPAPALRELPDGSLELIDGHLRTETTPDAIVPVLVLDVDEAEAAKILATFDPLGAMAETDGAALAALLAEVQTGDAALEKMLADLQAGAGLIAPLPEGGRARRQRWPTASACHPSRCSTHGRVIGRTASGNGWRSGSNRRSGAGKRPALRPESATTILPPIVR